MISAIKRYLPPPMLNTVNSSTKSAWPKSTRTSLGLLQSAAFAIRCQRIRGSSASSWISPNSRSGVLLMILNPEVTKTGSCDQDRNRLTFLSQAAWKILRTPSRWRKKASILSEHFSDLAMRKKYCTEHRKSHQAFRQTSNSQMPNDLRRMAVKMLHRGAIGPLASGCIFIVKKGTVP